MASGLNRPELNASSGGDIMNIGSQGSDFKGSRGTTRPLELVRHAGHGRWDESVRATVGLTIDKYTLEGHLAKLGQLHPTNIGDVKIVKRVSRMVDAIVAQLERQSQI